MRDVFNVDRKTFTTNRCRRCRYEWATDGCADRTFPFIACPQCEELEQLLDAAIDQRREMNWTHDQLVNWAKRLAKVTPK